MLYSPAAMVVAQTLLVVPLMAAITRQVVGGRGALRRGTAGDALFVVGQRPRCCNDRRHSLVVAVLAGLGRAMSEVGAVMIVGGNIDGAARVMTTAIALPRPARATWRWRSRSAWC